ncbi:MAG: DUF4815 domain-containing protein, partial [Proteobacteria bacterium]|nr:DUF4815 domain-containing protein [Pseudomonadota bacterium]
MSNKITINTNQSPYFDDFDDNDNFHQVLYKPALPVQARELTTQQSILRDQIKKFGDHVFQNGSKVTGGELVLNLEYEYVKLKPQYNSVDINVAGFEGKTIIGSKSGTKALVLGNSAIDTTTSDPNTLYVKYITGGSTTDKVQSIDVVEGGNSFTTEPVVMITGGGGSGASASAVVNSGSVIAINVTSKGTGYTTTPTVTLVGGNGVGAEANAVRDTSAAFLAGERIASSDLSISADVVDSTPTNIQTINITRGGSGYTEAPTVTIANAPVGGINATATSTISGGIVTSITVMNQGAGYTEAPTVTVANAPAGGVTSIATSTLATAVGKGSSVSIAEGVFYVNGNFIKTTQQTIILDKYFNDPSYKVGITATETIIDSGEDLNLLDNSQGSSNFAAPGADRLKLSLTLAKKVLTSTDDTDFYELLRINKGIKEKDIQVPIYSVLENTFARRTFDESGSYTVRSFNVQLRDDPDDATKFIVRLDPGKAFIEGLEYETIISSDIRLDRAREVVNVNGFDRLMQYGNFVITKEINGLFNISTHQTVDLHSVTSSSVVLTNPTTYTNTKIGTAKVRSIDFSSGSGTSRIINLYLYDLTMSSSNFAAVESLVVPVDSSVTPVVIQSSANIDDTGKFGGTSAGDARLFETSDNTLVFKLPQDTVQTIRGLNGVIDTSYTIKRVFESVPFDNSGQATIATAGGSETFFGTGVLSATNKREGYLAVVKNVGTSSFVAGQIVPFDTGGTIEVNGPQNTTATLNANVNTNFTADIIATINTDSKQERVKNLVGNVVETKAAPSTISTTSDSLNKSDIWKLKAVYDSGDINNAAVLPTLTVGNTSDTLSPGETITGLTSGATGTVVLGAGGTTSVTYVPVSGTFVAENVTGATSNFTKVVSSVATGDTNITTQYELDDGQRDNIYEHGSIKLKAGGTAPTGQTAIVFDHFTHTGVGYLSVDSYTAAIGFDNIPKYTSPVTGIEVELRDCVDFRPRRADGGTTIENIELPVPNSNWQADFSYYLPRIDTVYLSRERKFGSNTGISSLNTIPPARLDGTMNLYTIFIPAFTFKAKDVRAEYIENKRYTMRDIGKLEKRLSNVEYYTSLSLLEKDAEGLTIKDAAGLERFKNGFLVDGFNGHSVGNVLSADYQCSIDFDEKTLRPRFTSNITDVIYDESASTGVRKTGDCITLPYDNASFVSQPVASRSVNLNPFAVLAWVGTVDLTPPNDNWIDTTTNPEVVVNLQGENDAWESLVGLSFGTQFNDWQTINTGREVVIGTIAGTRRADGGGGRAAIRATQTIQQEITQTRLGIRNEITGSDAVRNSIG